MRAVVVTLSAAILASGAGAGVAAAEGGAPAAGGARAAAAPLAVIRAARDPLAGWLDATARLRDAAADLGSWLRDAPERGARVVTLFQVQLRQALAAGERWLATVTADLGPAIIVPDLSALVAAPVRGVASSGFGWREDPIHKRRSFHRGGDYRAPRGTPVYAAGGGVVAFRGRKNGYGKVVFVDHGGGVQTRYAHLRAFAVAEGDVIAADTKLGEVGATGRATGPHLHFEVRIDGRAVDPDLALEIAALQRTQPPGIARLAAMALAPEVQAEAVSALDPPRPAKHQRKGDRKNRPERTGRTRRPKPVS